jgi:hypothetical protein
MAQELLTAENFGEINILGRSELASDVVADTDDVVVKNANGFAVGRFFVLDIPGKETAELHRVEAISGNNITTVDNVERAHRRNELVTILRYNQIRFYRAPNVTGDQPADSDFAVLTTVDIDVDSEMTDYIDTDGGSGYWYKFTYYNSITDTETSLADADSVRGGNYGRYVTVFEVRREAGLEDNQFITDEEVYEKLLAAEGEADSALVDGGHTLPLASVPEVIKQAIRLIAAGFLLVKDYGPEHNGTNKDGERKLAMGRAMLAKIANKSTTITVNGETVTVGTGVRGYPLNDEVETSITRERMFTRDQEF